MLYFYLACTVDACMECEEGEDTCSTCDVGRFLDSNDCSGKPMDTRDN